MRSWLLGLKPDQVAVAEIKEGTAAVLLREAGVELILANDPANTGQLWTKFIELSIFCLYRANREFSFDRPQGVW